MKRELTEQEEKAIKKLKAVAKTWPDSLWLFSGSGTLCVMKCGKDGERVYTEGRSPGIDDDYTVNTINIPNDGGDW